MAKVTIEIEGMDAALASLERFPEQARVALTDLVQKTAFAARQRMIATAPRDTGRLRLAVTLIARGLSGRVMMGGDAYYWRFIEYGTQFVRARPFVRTAREQELATFPQRVRQVADKLERDFATSRFG